LFCSFIPKPLKVEGDKLNAMARDSHPDWPTEQWAKQMAEMQDVLRKALGGQGFAQWAKQMAETQEALRSALGSQAVAQWAKQTAETQEALRKALASQAWEGTQEALRALAPVVKSYEREPRTEKPVEVSPNPEAAKPEVRMLARHADREWLNTEEARRLTLRIEQQRQQSVLVLVADIRKSTQAMMEALDPFEYASTITAFVEQSRHAVLSEGGLFDKFTGDGFLAYWPYDARTHLRARRRSLDVIKSIFISFAQETMPRLRRNSQSLPSELGLAFGIDEGLVSFVTISRDLTIVGRPVVGAVRMVGGAVAGQVIVNVHVGEEIQDDVHAGRLPGIELVPTDIPGKEYPRQMAFVVRFVDFSLPEN